MLHNVGGPKTGRISVYIPVSRTWPDCKVDVEKWLPMHRNKLWCTLFDCTFLLLLFTCLMQRANETSDISRWHFILHFYGYQCNIM